MAGKGRVPFFRYLVFGVALLVIVTAVFLLNQSMRLPRIDSLNAPASGQPAPATTATPSPQPLEGINVAALKDRGDLAIVWDDLLYLVEGKTGKTRQLSDSGQAYGPRWSPDGQWLAYLRLTRPSNQEGTLWLVRRDGTQSHQVPLQVPSIRNSDFRWSPTANELLVHSSGIWLVPTEGAPRQLVAADPFPTDPEFAPDGKRIAYSLVTPEDEAIFTLSLTPGSQPVEQLREPRSGITVATWWPNGQGLLYRKLADLRDDRDGLDRTATADYYTLPLDSWQPRRMSDHSFWPGFTIAKNGLAVFITEGDQWVGGKNLVVCNVMNAACEVRESLAAPGLLFTAAYLSPDGNRILMEMADRSLLADYEIRASYWLANTDGTARRYLPLTGVRMGVWTQDGSRLFLMYEGALYLFNPADETWEKLVGPAPLTNDRARESMREVEGWWPYFSTSWE